MRIERKAWILLIGVLAPLALEAQSAPDTKSSQSSAQSEAGEPRATTSPDVATQDPGSGKAAAGTPSPAGPPSSAASSEAADGAGTRPARRAPAGTDPAPAGSSPAGGGAAGGTRGPGKPGAVDRLELGTATVTGDREQPKVMYIVPWKRSDIGDLSGKPMNSLLDEALAPIDREEFKRQVMYYQAVRADAAQNGASKTPAQGEK
jgi:hypothetical protein